MKRSSTIVATLSALILGIAAPPAASAQEYELPALPAGYQLVQYLETVDNNQYINTGFAVTNVPQLGLRMVGDGTGSANGVDACYSFGTASPGCALGYDKNGGICFVYSSSPGVTTSWSGSFAQTHNMGANLEIASINWMANGGYRHIGDDNGGYSTASAPGTSTKSVLLFCVSYGTGTFGTAANVKCYAAAVSYGDKVVRNLVPVLDASNTPAMYDLVTSNTYYNAGSSTAAFAYGSVVTSLDDLSSAQKDMYCLAAVDHEHEWLPANSTYTWEPTEAGFDCEAQNICTFSGCGVVTTEVSTATSEIIKAATTQEEGTNRWTAVFVGSMFATQIKDVAIPVLDARLWKLPQIPQGYKIVQYIASQGGSTQWIDTGITVTNAAAFGYRLVGDGSQQTQSESFVFGIMNPNVCISYKKSGEVQFLRKDGLGYSTWPTAFAKTHNTATALEVASLNWLDDGGHRFIGDDDGGTATDPAPPSDISSKGMNVRLFALNFGSAGSTYGYSGGVKCHGAAVSYEDKVVRNLVPVLDAADVPAMYDLVTGNTFYLQGTGSFAYGDVVTDVDQLSTAQKEMYCEEWSGATIFLVR